MMNNDNIFNKIAEALLVDYTSVYYVNAVTNEYQWYSNDPEFHSLHIEPSGKDFFKDLLVEADRVVYEEDKHIFMEDMQKDILLAQVKKGDMQSLSYRLMIDGRPVYHTLRLIRGVKDGDDYFILGVINSDKEMKMKQQAEKTEAERTVYNQIAHSLAAHYDTLYYIDIETDNYFEFTSTDRYKSLKIPTSGDDFFTESAKNSLHVIHPDDLKRVQKYFTKSEMLKNLKNNHTFQREYRIMLDGNTVNMRCRQIWASDKKHVIVCLENIDDEIRVQQKYRENQFRSEVYRHIAESLASQYDVIYYVNVSDNTYIEFTANLIYGNLNIPDINGEDFFKEADVNCEKIIYPKDRDNVKQFLNKDKLTDSLDDNKQLSLDYRMLINGDPKYTRMTVTWSGDRTHLIFGVENIHEEIKRKKEQAQALNHANEIARKDPLTGTKNNLAFRELQATLQKRIDSGTDYLPFAFVVCDLNGLKEINDNGGWKAGDDYICAASRLICNVFTHSPVFRTGGDEFVVFLGSSDFLYRDSLLSRLRDQVQENMAKGGGPVLASGMAAYEPSSDEKVSEVQARAYSRMYEDKTRLKSGNIAENPVGGAIPDADKEKLSALFDAFSLVSEGSYIYICDMRYDYSKWSKKAVDLFGLPSEYMYGAGDIWEKHIHPEDRDTYHIGINDIFSGNASGHDMQYRARKTNGDYDVCTCRGIVLRDENGKPKYFCGAIRNHDMQEHIDSLTGLRNQYGFFEDLQAAMAKHAPMRVYMIVINKFSEINEVYGYQFGNTILQKFGRCLFEHVGNSGHVYRLDGTKFAVISKSRSAEEIRESYDLFRQRFRKGISLDDKFVILDLSAGLLNVDNFDIDHQTVYACLNFAYGESKVRRQGEMVEFYNELNTNNKYRLEKLYAIRASIMQSYKGFYLLYQPVVDASTEKLIGAEALLRWRSDEYGMVPPDHFIPILEKDPLFCDLGQWVLRTAINGAKIVMQDHPDFVINVNLSYTQLEKPDFVDMVLRTLKEEGFPPNHLCLEITERCRLLDMYLLKNVIVNLRGRGIQIALDDFGTGFSSIGIVKNLPFDTIKIDRSFVRMIEEDEKERELIKSFVSMAATFGAKVCVEGIETEGMRDILQKYNIQSFQGYYYAKPLELRDFIIWDPKKDLQ
ncbi:MAG: EAL domain-containing protein [Ruminococcus sp.]|nr:EAL domain-containing protein [Ruminococcus sp.]